MAEVLPPGTPEVDDPLLVADLIRLLRIKGAIGRLPLADVVVPVVNLGDVVTPSINVRSPAFRSTDVFSEGFVPNLAAGIVVADTGPLVAGTYDVGILGTGIDNENFSAGIDVQHRNAANNATLATWPHMMYSVSATVVPMYWFGYELGDQERLRGLNRVQTGVNEGFTLVIFARLRT